MSQRHYATCDQPATLAVARSGGVDLARTTRPVVLREFADKAYPPVIYFPRADVDMSQLVRTPRSSSCPIKGEATWYRLAGDGDGAEEIAWAYEDPLPGVEAIRRHIAFYSPPIDVTTAE